MNGSRLLIIAVRRLSRRTADNNRFNSQYSYDARGNILTLSRNGQYWSGTCWDIAEIDDMSYSYYSGTNRLSSITDAATCPSNLTITQPITQSSNYAVTNNLQAQSQVSGNRTVLYRAGNEVELSAGFTFDSDGTGLFTAETGDCNGLGNTYFTSGFNQGSTAGSYTYDANGNLTFDPNKDLIIVYNHLNLPEKVLSTDSTKVIEWLYDATGVKLRKTVLLNGDTLLKHDYLSGLEFRNDTLEAIYHAEGRLYYDDSGQSRHEYNLTDHLGNTRLVF